MFTALGMSTLFIMSNIVGLFIYFLFYFYIFVVFHTFLVMLRMKKNLEQFDLNWLQFAHKTINWTLCISAVFCRYRLVYLLKLFSICALLYFREGNPSTGQTMCAEICIAFMLTMLYVDYNSISHDVHTAYSYNQNKIKILLSKIHWYVIQCVCW